MRFQIREGVVAYAHPGWRRSVPKIAWTHNYPNEWHRRTVMDKDGRALYTVWSGPGL